jgi:hypothetical protein
MKIISPYKTETFEYWIGDNGAGQANIEITISIYNRTTNRWFYYVDGEGGWAIEPGDDIIMEPVDSVNFPGLYIFEGLTSANMTLGHKYIVKYFSDDEGLPAGVSINESESYLVGLMDSDVQYDTSLQESLTDIKGDGFDTDTDSLAVLASVVNNIAITTAESNDGITEIIDNQIPLIAKESTLESIEGELAEIKGDDFSTENDSLKKINEIVGSTNGLCYGINNVVSENTDSINNRLPLHPATEESVQKIGSIECDIISGGDLYKETVKIKDIEVRDGDVFTTYVDSEGLLRTYSQVFSQDIIIASGGDLS